MKWELLRRLPEKSADILQVKIMARSIYSTSSSKRQQAMNVAKGETLFPFASSPREMRFKQIRWRWTDNGGCHKLSKVLAYCLV